MSSVPIARYRQRVRTQPGASAPSQKVAPATPSDKAVPQLRTAPSVDSEVRYRARPSVVSQAAAFLLIMGFSYMAFSVVGQVMLESQRRQGIEAALSAREARRMEVVLKERVDAVTSLTSVHQWAASRGFVAPDRLADPSGKAGRIASR